MEKILNLLPEAVQIEGAFEKKEIRIDGKKLNIEPSRKVWNKSAEFSWGYAGAGPSQLALAILLKYWKKEDALKWFQSFKFAFIGGLPSTDFIKTVNLRAILKEIMEKEPDKLSR